MAKDTQPQPGYSSRKKILIIDAEENLCMLMKAYYLRKNYEVYVHHNLDQALDNALSLQPDFIFLDTEMCHQPEVYMHQLRQLVPHVQLFSRRGD